MLRLSAFDNGVCIKKVEVNVTFEYLFLEVNVTFEYLFLQINEQIPRS